MLIQQLAKIKSYVYHQSSLYRLRIGKKNFTRPNGINDSRLNGLFIFFFYQNYYINCLNGHHINIIILL